MHVSVRVGLLLIALAGITPSVFCQPENPQSVRHLRHAPIEAPTRLRPIRPDPVGAWLPNHGNHQLSTARAGTNPDLLPLSPWIAGADIVGLGDGTHGTHEFYTLKERILDYLAGADGFRAIAFEGQWNDFSEMNDYIHGGEGDPSALLRMEGYFFWEYEEMREFLEWARRYNATRSPEERIELLGFDVYAARNSADAVLSFLEIDTAARTIAEKEYACVLAFPGALSCPSSILVVRANLEAKMTEYVAATSRRQYLHALQSARVIEQSREIFVDRDQQDRVRDRLMAENTDWIQSEWLEGRRLLLWGHNEHIGRTPFYLYDGSAPIESLGAHLASLYGTRYFPIGTCMGEGTMTTFDVKAPGGRGTVAMQPVTPGNYELLFAQAGFATIAIPLFEPDIPSWLEGPARLRFGTSSYRPSEYHNPTLSLPEKFDAIIYVDKTTPTRPLP